MRTKEELRAGVSTMLRDLRARRKLSKAKMARLLDIDDHTWNSWESGKTCPSVADFLSVFDACGESVMRPILSFLYPDQYGADAPDLRARLTHFVNEVAADHAIEIMSFLAFGDHGSNFNPQIELMCAYNHLPLEQRFIVAEMVYTSFLISANRGDLVANSSVMPAMPIWEEGLRQAQRAAYKRMYSYSNMTEEEVPEDGQENSGSDME